MKYVLVMLFVFVVTGCWNDKECSKKVEVTYFNGDMEKILINGYCRHYIFLQNGNLRYGGKTVASSVRRYKVISN